MKILLLILAFCFSINSFAVKGKWKKHYNLVLSDIRSVEALGTNDLSLRVRLFELYGEKFSLLLERESAKRIIFLESGQTKQLDKLLKAQKKTLRKLDSIAQKIERQTKNRKILTKINYFRALNYHLARDNDKFFLNIKKAESTNKDKKLGYLINTKLADYHFNEKQYKEAANYYRKLIHNKKNGWITKHFYNLAWCELKLGQFELSIKHLKSAYYFEKKKGYLKIGDQMVDSLLLFHAYSKKTKDGLNYLEKQKIDTFKNLLQYLHYTFESGDKKTISYIIRKIRSKKLSANQEYMFLSKQILIYRTIKKFSRIQKNFNGFKKKLKRIKLSEIKKENKEELIKAIKSYSGFLQELIKSEYLVSQKKKNSYVKYTAYNFGVLKLVDPANALEYSFFEGETYFSLNKFKKAGLIYAKGIKRFRKTGVKKNLYLPKVFDSLFKSLENQSKPSMKTLLFAYTSYLHYFPRGPRTNLVYQRLINLYKKKGQEGKMFTTLKSYNKNHPKDVKIQRGFYKEVLNRYIDKKNVGALVSLQGLINKKFLGLTSVESKKITKIISQIYFSKYESLAKKGQYKKAIIGFDKLFNDKTSKYTLRVDSLRKKMFYENKTFMYEGLGGDLSVAFNFFKNKEKFTHNNELLYYVENICVGDVQDVCLKLLKIARNDKIIKVTKNLDLLYFKLSAVKSDDFNSIYRLAKTNEDKNYIFKLLLVSNPSFSSKLYVEFYKSPEKRSVIEKELERRVLNTFYSTLSFEKARQVIAKISITSLKNKISTTLNETNKILNNVEFKLPPTPKEDIVTETIFMKFGQDVDSKVSDIFSRINTVIKKSKPNFLPYILSKIIINFEREVDKFKKFIPVSKNPDLENAMSDAVTGFHKVFDKKLIDYRSLYFQSVEKTVRGSGVKVYSEDIITKPMRKSLRGIEIWQE